MNRNLIASILRFAILPSIFVAGQIPCFGTGVQEAGYPITQQLTFQPEKIGTQPPKGSNPSTAEDGQPFLGTGSETQATEQRFSPLEPMATSGSTPLSTSGTAMDDGMTGSLQSYFDSTILSDQQPNSASLFNRLLDDQKNFYSRGSMLSLGLIFGAGAVVANTDLDQQIHRRFQTNVRGAASDEWFEFLHANKELGNGYYTLPIMGGAWLISETIDGPPQLESLGVWGERSLRGFAVGVVPLVVMQSATGASRPEEPNGSGWRPFQDDNGVSGHSFMSALPFITAAKLTDSRWKKAFWYSASAIGPLSRVNDNAHYPSQAGLGWCLAFAAASAVDQSATNRRPWSLVPLNSPGYSGAGVEFRW